MDEFTPGKIAKVKSSGEVGQVVYSDMLGFTELRFDDDSFYVYKTNQLELIPNHKMTKIALIGRMRSGKDTVADYLIKQYNYRRFAFGDELKRYYHELFGQTDSKPREGYQRFGQLMRTFEPDVWLNKCFEMIDRHPLHKIVITDLRQPNEYEKCKQEGFVLIKVECDDELRLRRIMEKQDNFNPESLKHETESHIDEFECDYIIKNNRTLEELHTQIDEIIKEIESNGSH
jgi:dephospho-CoA kinase